MCMGSKVLAYLVWVSKGSVCQGKCYTLPPNTSLVCVFAGVSCVAMLSSDSRKKGAKIEIGASVINDIP
jgi:hypothetical protein